MGKQPKLVVENDSQGRRPQFPFLTDKKFVPFSREVYSVYGIEPVYAVTEDDSRNYRVISEYGNYLIPIGFDKEQLKRLPLLETKSTQQYLVF